jgi:hypothetical protein
MTTNVTGVAAQSALWPGTAVRRPEPGFEAQLPLFERAAANPADVSTQLRQAAVRRDAPVPAASAPERAAAEAHQAALRSVAGTTSSLTVTTALAAYAAAAASAPRNPVLLPAFEAVSDEPATPEGEPAESDDTTPVQTPPSKSSSGRSH